MPIFLRVDRRIWGLINCVKSRRQIQQDEHWGFGSCSCHILSSVLTRACLNAVGNVPVWREVLIMWVSAGMTEEEMVWRRWGMIGKGQFGHFRLQERKEGDGRVCICHYEVIISLWCEEFFTDGSCFICEENCKVTSSKSWWSRRGRRTEKRKFWKVYESQNSC